MTTVPGLAFAPDSRQGRVVLIGGSQQGLLTLKVCIPLTLIRYVGGAYYVPDTLGVTKEDLWHQHHWTENRFVISVGGQTSLFD